jgi:hypothetical protein
MDPMASNTGLIHFHCGDAAAAVHRRSGLPGALRVWVDSPAVGPWTSGSGNLAALRTVWWGVSSSEWRDLPHLDGLARVDEPVLWFGPDPWEQACLLWVLAELPERALPDLVPLHHGVARMPPAALPRCFAERILLEADTLREARALWKMFLTKGWGALGGAQILALPWLGQALARLAEDHPPAGPGRTRRQIQGLVDQGVQDLPALLRALEQMEEARHGAWYGDLFVARTVEAMGVRLG